jgi:hypothetical protein
MHIARSGRSTFHGRLVP